MISRRPRTRPDAVSKRVDESAMAASTDAILPIRGQQDHPTGQPTEQSPAKPPQQTVQPISPGPPVTALQFAAVSLAAATTGLNDISLLPFSNPQQASAKYVSSPLNQVDRTPKKNLINSSKPSPGKTQLPALTPLHLDRLQPRRHPRGRVRRRTTTPAAPSPAAPAPAPAPAGSSVP